MHVRAICELLFLLALANVTPILLKDVIGARWCYPVDCGLVFFDGRPLLGSSKTIRGIVSSILVTSAAAFALRIGWTTGLLVAVFSMAGDMFSSFWKRRLCLPPSSRATGFDQIPESVFPALAVRHTLGLTYLDLFITALVFLLGEMVLSVIFFKLHFRDQPY